MDAQPNNQMSYLVLDAYVHFILWVLPFQQHGNETGNCPFKNSDNPACLYPFATFLSLLESQQVHHNQVENIFSKSGFGISPMYIFSCNCHELENLYVSSWDNKVCASL